MVGGMPGPGACDGCGRELEPPATVVYAVDAPRFWVVGEGDEHRACELPVGVPEVEFEEFLSWCETIRRPLAVAASPAPPTA